MPATADSIIPPAAQFTGEEWLVLGRALQRAGRHADAVSALQQAASRLPLNADVYLALVVSLDATGQKADAASARIGADAIGRRRAIDIFEIGRVYAKHRHWEAAAHWLEKALLVDPRLGAAHICLAWSLRQLGRQQPDPTASPAPQPGASDHEERTAPPRQADPPAQADARRRNLYLTYRRQSAFLAAKATRRRTVLVLCSSERANLPFRHLLPPGLNRMVRWVMDLGTVGIAWGRSRRLPRYDVVFNVIADADRAASCREEQARFMATDHGPVLNPPDRIEHTRRERTGALLDGVEDILVPATMRWDRQSNPAPAIHAALAVAGIGYPAIVRPAGEHGGEGVVLLSTPADATDPPAPGEMYLTRYHEYRSPDGHYRKYRVIFIDREPYPYHLAIGSQWLLHYFSADMLSAPWKLEEERRFLDDPGQALGARAWAALGAIGRRMDLDYCGIDFSLLPDGRVLVFEINATMLVHPEAEEDGLRFKNVYIDRIFDAFDALLTRRAAEANA
ncbi:tetratricopeptide repeat protein [Achromobacter aloeverae]